MAVKTVLIKGTNSQDMARQAREALAGFQPKLLLFFASSVYEHPEAALKEAFPNSEVIGSTSHSEYCNATFTSGAVSILAADQESVEDVCVRVVENISTEPDLKAVLEDMHNYYGGVDQVINNYESYVGLVIFESSAKSEEVFMDRLGTVTDLLFVGGSSSAADSGQSLVYANGQSYSGAAVLAILKTVNGYDVFKTQSAHILSERKLLVTKSDMRNRILYEFDGRPCGEVYAEVLGVPQDEIQNYFVSNPLGVVADGEIFVRTFNQIQDGGITLHCGLPEGTEINVLKIGNIVDDTKKALDQAITYQPAGLINFNCLYRTLEIQNENQVEPYCALFGQYPSIGFSTNGEAFFGHINETSTVLVIK
ncbi:FIST signal transduction protein [Acutalibacter intestini]|uniref:FIST signal transduction protein n=1 Tax=Acutalibacter intestini TaxID=3093659 RepID=UPI002AC91E5D|nr:FIST N-terminal domain-containing protein [Acutalibacter sp. M00204]